MPSLKPSLGNRKRVSLDSVCELLSKETTTDELGQEVEVNDSEAKRQVFCSELSVSRTEFFAAGQLDRKPQMIILVNSEEYDQEMYLEYETVQYVIYRHFMRADGHTELYCEVRTGVY